VRLRRKKKQKPRCPVCGRKISRTDRLKKKLIERTSIQFSEQFRQEYEERKDWCLKCLTKYFKPKFKEASKELKGKIIPKQFKGLLKKGEEAANE
jgi:ribosomal protein L34E